MSNLPNYPESVTAWDVEAYYYGQRESSALDMIYPRCTECGIEVMVIGMTCDECKEGIAEMDRIMAGTHEVETPLSAVLSFAAICSFFGLLFVAMAVWI